MNNLGLCYENGTGVTRNVHRAVQLYQQAVDLGDADSMLNLGVCYENGTGVERYVDRAVQLYQQAAELGNAAAMNNLGFCYSIGTGVTRDVHRAVQLYQQAVELGDARGMINLGVCYENGTGVERNVDRAVQQYQQAAELGNARGMNNLGLCYENGTGVERDVHRAVQLYQQATDLGNAAAMTNLGVSLFNGDGTSQDYSKACKLFVDAAEKNDETGLRYVGLCYENGFGVPQDKKRALQIYKTLAQKDNALALMLLASCYANGVAVKQDFEKSFDCIRRAEALGTSADACASIAYWYRHGIGVDVSLEMATETCTKLASAGNEEAQFMLADLLSVSPKVEDLCRAHHLARNISPGSNRRYRRAQWLCHFFDKYMDVFRYLYGTQSFGVEWHDSIPVSALKLVAKIGEGQFGDVYLAWYKDSKWVAVKYIPVRLISTKESEYAATNTMMERFIWRTVEQRRIPNMARYIGLVDDIESDLVELQQVGLVFEICADLTHVRDEAKNILDAGKAVISHAGNYKKLDDWSDRVRSSLRQQVVFAGYPKYRRLELVRMARDVAVALNGLHEAGIIHRDLAPRNVLCDEHGNVQLTDLGLSKFVGFDDDDDDAIVPYQSTAVAGKQYAVAWMAPESLAQGRKPGIFSSCSDVYSFGVLLWQLFARQDPYSDLQPTFDDTEETKKEKGNAIMSKIENGELLDLEQMGSVPIKLKELVRACWAADPMSRPSVKTIIEKLNNIMEDGWNLVKNTDTQRRFAPPIVSSHDRHQRWTDVKQLYMQRLRETSLQEIRERDTNPASFAPQFWIHLMRSARHPVAPSRELPPSIRSKFPFPPVDVFIINTMAEKHGPAATLKGILSRDGFQCLLDADLKRDDGPPRDIMRSHMETCRYAFAVVSKATLESDNCRDEIVYAFERMKRIGRGPAGGWESFRVVLYDMSVSQYKAAQKSKYPDLPDVCSEATVTEWFHDGKGPLASWDDRCYLEKQQMVLADKEKGAVQRWKEFLQSAADTKHADKLYGKDR